MIKKFATLCLIGTALITFAAVPAQAVSDQKEITIYATMEKIANFDLISAYQDGNTVTITFMVNHNGSNGYNIVVNQQTEGVAYDVMLASDDDVNNFNFSQAHQVAYTGQNQATINKVYVMTLTANNITDIQDQIVIGLEDEDITKQVNLAVALTPENTVAVN